MGTGIGWQVDKKLPKFLNIKKNQPNFQENLLSHPTKIYVYGDRAEKFKIICR